MKKKKEDNLLPPMIRRLIILLLIVGCEEVTEPSQEGHYTCIIEYEELEDNDDDYDDYSGDGFIINYMMIADTFVVHATNISDAIYLCERTSSSEELSTCNCEAGIN